MPKKVNKTELSTQEDLDPRWARFIDAYLESGNAYQSALTAGFAESYALVIKSRFPEKVRKSLNDALEAEGISAEKIAEKVNWLLDSDEYQAVDKGITHAAKIGVGGGYAPEKHITLNLEISQEERDLARKALEAI